MNRSRQEAGGSSGPLASLRNSVTGSMLKLAGLAIVDALGLWLLYLLIRDGVWPLAASVVVVTILVNIINLSPQLYPLRWMSPSFTIILLLVLYPILFTVYTAFTNYSDGHLLTKTQTIRRLTQDLYLPEGGETYQWTAYRSEDSDLLLWLVGERGETYIARPGQPLEEASPATGGVGPLDESGSPVEIDGYGRLEVRDVLPILDSQLAQLEFGRPPDTIKIRNLREAAPLVQRYVYDEQQDAIIDHLAGTVYFADPERGFFISEDGEILTPGYQVVIGFDNFERLFQSPALRGPFLQVFVWTIAFAFFSVVTTFAAGLFMALVMNDPILPVRKMIRTLLILPYAIPGVIGILIWRGMLNPHLGVITTNMVDLIGWAPDWFIDPWWSKAGILLVNLWLGYPYMMLICSGALQAIPSDVYEAADVDGASGWQSFRAITLPLLLISVGPLLIASFTFNFNNFAVIYAYNEGRPPIPGTTTPAGYTDILISYTFRLAFEGGRGAEYAYAAAITIVIFFVVALITLLQYRFMGTWEEMSESL